MLIKLGSNSTHTEKAALGAKRDPSPHHHPAAMLSYVHCARSEAEEPYPRSWGL